MTSIHLSERVNVQHLEHHGKPVKMPDDLSIEDFIPDSKELEFLFCSLVPLYSYSLLKRHPAMYKSLKSAILEYIPHQFQGEMNLKSEEFTGEIYTKSECKTEELINMLEEYQTHMVVKDETVKEQPTLYRRQLTGDQKTEKNTTFAILSKADEDSMEGRLSFLIPGHEYFHFLMCLGRVK